jgi:Family of unknown function (DUF6596)
MLAGLMPEDPEVLGPLALMEIQASRHRARTGPDGAFISLTEQDRTRWDHLLIRRGLDALARVEALDPKAEDAGPYVLQAALARLPGARAGILECHRELHGAPRTRRRTQRGWNARHPRLLRGNYYFSRGRRLIDFARPVIVEASGASAEWCRHEAVTRVCVCVDAGSPDAEPFYESVGACRLKKHWRVWDDSGVWSEVR